MTAPPDRRKRERLTPQLTTGHQQLHARCFQKGIRHIHAVGHHNRILMVAQLTGNLIRRGTGVQNHTQPRRISSAATDAILRLIVVWRVLLSSSDGSLTGETPHKSAHRHRHAPRSPVFEEGEVIADSHCGNVKLLRQLIHLNTAVGAQKLDDMLTPPARSHHPLSVPHPDCS